MALPQTRDAATINLLWLLRLRGGAIAGQLGTIFTVHVLMGIPLPLGPLLGLIALEVVTNLFVALWVRRAARPDLVSALSPALMVLDVLVLSGLLYFTGGPVNPFSFLYLVYIALAAIILPGRWTWALVLLSVACSGVLFLRHQVLQAGDISHEALMAFHLRGMWVAYSVAASFIVYFLLRVTRALARREIELQEARSLAARQEKLASLATLAAGAAHELSTPLSTIAVVARELERHLSEGPALSDVHLIRSEVERCRAVLSQMAAEAGESTGEGLTAITMAELVAEALRGLPASGRVRVEAAEGPRVEVPLRALGQTVRALLKNAVYAGSPGEVTLCVGVEEGSLRIEVRDVGSGMAEDVLLRAGEPFYTTKPPGQGMGLGLFLARAVVERLGGRLRLTSTRGQGTAAHVEIPLTAPASICHIAGAAETRQKKTDSGRPR